MTRYWCVNFDSPACLKHGIEKQLWLMQYQYKDDHGNVYQDENQSSATTKIWRRLADIQEGDRFLAYLKRNRFFAIGTVRQPRRAKTRRDHVDTVENYINQRKSHKHKTGYVYYTPVFYEDFDDRWRAPANRLMRYPQRIEVDEWQFYVPAGVEATGLNTIPPNELQMAVFEIGKRRFEKFTGQLAKAHADRQNEEDRVIEAFETNHGSRQGFLVDSRVRKALEDHAMAEARRYFENRRFQVEDHSKNHSYDLRCTQGEQVLYVEVKGTQSSGSEVILTRAEVEFAKRHSRHMVLFIVHSIEVSNVNGRVVPKNGTVQIIRPWNVELGELSPIAFNYEIPKNLGDELLSSSKVTTRVLSN